MIGIRSVSEKHKFHPKDLGKRTLSNSSDEEDPKCVCIRNANIENMRDDVLYHFALGTATHDLHEMFSDVKFVCVGGSPRRMEKIANYMLDALDLEIPAGQTLTNIARATDRYALYKVGPVISASHGIGTPSLSIMLHEIFKILYHAGAQDVSFFRLGTSGGLGLKPGTVVVSDEAVDGLLEPQFELAVLGKMVKRPAILDEDLVKELISYSQPDDEFDIVRGKTMCTPDFYEGQGRLDGAFCDYTEDDKMNFLQEVHQKGVRNIEMEATCLAAMCHHAGIKCGIICVTIVDRLQGDQISTPLHVLKEWEERPAKIMSRHIRKRLGKEEQSVKEIQGLSLRNED